MEGRIRPLKWSGSSLLVLDQLALPQQEIWQHCYTSSQVADAIRGMHVRGAPAIGIAAAYGVALHFLQHRDAAAHARLRGYRAARMLLAETRPTAVNLHWALARMDGVVEESAGDSRRILAEAHAICEDDYQRCLRIGAYGSQCIRSGARILTYCNAGALATAGHGTALGVIRTCHDAGLGISVMACETRPYLQGARLTAWELMQERIPFSLITDNMAAFFFGRGEIDAVVVGADRIAENGDVANKIGTYNLAILAQYHNVPFYVAAPISTFDLKCRSGADIPIEERAADEVRLIKGIALTPPQAPVRHPAFDVTPASMISAIITDHGLIHDIHRDSVRAIVCGN